MIKNKNKEIIISKTIMLMNFKQLKNKYKTNLLIPH